MTARWALLFGLLLLWRRRLAGATILDDGACPGGWNSMGDVCLQPQLTPKDQAEASKVCRQKGARLLACPAVLDDVTEFLSALHDKGIAESTWLMAPKEDGPVSLRRAPNGTYFILQVPSPATFPFLCSLTPVGRRSALLQQQLGAKGNQTRYFDKSPEAPRLTWTTPREIFFHARPDADFLPLPCRVAAQPAATITWFKNDLQIMGGNDSVLVSGGTLLVPAASHLSYSTFHCVAANKFGKVRSPSVVLKPAFLDAFLPRRPDAVPLAEGGARLDCQAPAHQPKSQSFTWLVTNTDRPVVVSDRVFVSRDGSLLFSHVGPDDDSKYACSLSLSSTASGHYGPFFRLRVPSPQAHFKPRIDPSFPQVFPEFPVVGETVYVECFAYANPVAVYRWNRVDGKAFSQRVETLNHGRVLRIERARPSDAGRLRCSVANSLGASSAEVNLILKGPAPTVLLPLEDLVVATEEDFSLECVLSSSDLHSSVEWFKDTTPIVPLLMPSSQRRRFRVNHNKLSVTGVHPADQGVYQCTVTNEVGVASSSAHVTVRDTSPNFLPATMPQKVFANAGSNVTVPCVYQASPRGHSRWTSDGGARIPAKGRVREEDGVLHIDEVLPDDQGMFFCTARNRLGRAHSQLELIVTEKAISRKTRPGNVTCEIEWECEELACLQTKDREAKKRLPCHSALGNGSPLLAIPIGLRVENISDGLRLAWRMPSSGRETRDHQKNEVKGFLVEMRTREDRQWKAAPRGTVKATDADGLVLDDLVSNQQYQFRIRSVGSSFVGEASAPSSWIKTPPAPPRLSVEDLRWKALDAGSLLVEWEPLREQAGDNLRYVVSWSEAGHDDPAPTFFAHRMEAPLPQAIIRLNSTEGCRAVTLAVRAENNQGSALISSETVALVGNAGRPGRIEEETVEAVNGTHVRLSWKWSDDGDCAAPRVVKISCEEDAYQPVAVTAAGDTFEWILGGLQPNSDYRCTLTPSDTSGHQGEPTLPLLVRTKVAPPLEAPVISEWSLKPSDKHDFTTILEWTAVDFGNDTLENVGYTIFVYIGQTASEAVKLRMPLERLSDQDHPSARVDGLLLMYLYTIQVSAYNSGGDGPRSVSRVIRLGSRRDEPSSSPQFHILVTLLLASCLL